MEQLALYKAVTVLSHYQTSPARATNVEEDRKGCATEAGRAVIESVKKERGIEGAFNFCDPMNARSRRAMEKAGL